MTKREEPSLQITFTYDHASGNFVAHLASGTSFFVAPSHVGGKLENSLTLFKRGVINSADGRWAKAPRKAPATTYAYSPGEVKRFDERGRPELNLEDLDLDLEF